MILHCQNVTKQVKMCRFLLNRIENLFFSVFMHYENFWSHKTIPQAYSPCYTMADKISYHDIVTLLEIVTLLFTLRPIKYCIIKLIQTWDIKMSRPRACDLVVIILLSYLTRDC